MDESERQLILEIQRAPLNEHIWSGFAAKLRTALRGNLTYISFRLPREGGFERDGIADGIAVRPWHREMAARFQDMNPIPYFNMTPGRIYSYEEFDTATVDGQDLFRDQFLDPVGIRHLLIFRVGEPSGFQMWVAIGRPEEEPSFDKQARDLCARLAEHLSLALNTHAALVRAKTEAETYAHAASRLSFGIISLSMKGEVLTVDAEATRTMTRTGLLSVADGQLRALESGSALRRLIQELLRQDADMETRSIQIGGPEGLDLLLIPQPVRADAGVRQPRILVYISGRQGSDRDMSRQIARLFGLSKSQARLTASLVSGHSLAAAAGEIGVTEQTARTYSKEIYARVGVRGQSELIQRILTSVAMLDKDDREGAHDPGS